MDATQSHFAQWRSRSHFCRCTKLQSVSVNDTRAQFLWPHAVRDWVRLGDAETSDLIAGGDFPVNSLVSRATKKTRFVGNPWK
jgi:hypothetical protein